MPLTDDEIRALLNTEPISSYAFVPVLGKALKEKIVGHYLQYHPSGVSAPVGYQPDTPYEPARRKGIIKNAEVIGEKVKIEPEIDFSNGTRSIDTAQQIEEDKNFSYKLKPEQKIVPDELEEQITLGVFLGQSNEVLVSASV